ncbi:hypothetical protein [Photobacterium leiognathi]|uniref:hypothetical protein n=1 Tax=Photobacterium leiognathi TaxID=553611 RepID=UPI0029811D1A|nr:hypothetical protein [Photobacterium leiognathi]
MNIYEKAVTCLNDKEKFKTLPMCKEDAVNFLVNDLVVGVCEFKRDVNTSTDKLNIKIDPIHNIKRLNDAGSALLNHLKDTIKPVLITMHNDSFSKEICFLAELNIAKTATMKLRGFQ